MQRAASEVARIEEVVSEHAARAFIVSWQTVIPNNPERLQNMMKS